ncbi:MAG TPA: hypothetical protein VFA20_06185 [Myxococcaceae bacterium]|nr:hypothetical protein [Myxococcaceae bacterium]
MDAPEAPKPPDRPSYLKAAFLNPVNLTAMASAAGAAALTGDWLIGVVAAGVEALWLLWGPDFKPFKRAVDKTHREEKEKAEAARVQKLLETLPPREWDRAKALDQLRRDIRRDMEQNPSFQAMLLSVELDKLQQLYSDFVGLAAACTRAEAYLAGTDPRDVNRQIDVQKNLEKSLKDAAAQEIARKNRMVLERRLSTISEIQNFLARARGQMNLIENSVRLLRDQVLTMASPEQLGDQLDDLITGVEAIQESAKEHEALLGKMDLPPVAPVEASRAPEAPGRLRE